MTRVPESLERVRALVCEFCWVNCFDTAGFEQLGRSEIEEFEYYATEHDLLSGKYLGCPWCSLIESEWCGFREDEADSIILAVNDFYHLTPAGSNFYTLRICGMSYHLSLFTDANNFAAQQVTARKVETDLTPSNTFAQISCWLNECALHKCCPEQIDGPLPTRVIEVATPRVLHINGAPGRFAALSYCWGNGSQIQLLSHTIESLTDRLELESLPQTIKDAILVARSISIPYLWVDALCIIQDDEADKAREIGSMAQIYSNAYITIVASAAADAADGFLGRRAVHGPQDIELPFRVSLGQFGSVYAKVERPPWLDQRPDNPLDRRAWTLQEQTMASRLLLYTPSTLEWRCAAGMMSLNNSLNVDSSGVPMPKLVSQISKDQEGALQEWESIIKNYSRRAMSIESDKLPAIAALAERFAPILGKYFAGIWQYDFVKQLHWIFRYGTLRKRVKLYRAPSWSWASNDGDIWIPNVRPKRETCCTLVSVESVPKNKQVPYGEVVNASMTVRGRVLVGFVTRGKKTEAECTITHTRSEIMELPLRRFYNIYFGREIVLGESIQTLEVPMFRNMDAKYPDPNPLLVLLLPLHIDLVEEEYLPECYDRYRADSAEVSHMLMCTGLILVPAGPGVVRRIGKFFNLHANEIQDVGEQEITIV